MALYIDSKDCKAAVVLYSDKTVITRHDPKTQSLSLPLVPVLRKHLTAILSEEPNEFARAVHETVTNIELNPILGAFAYAALEHVSSMNYTIKNVKYVKDKDFDYLFRSSIYPICKYIFAIEVTAPEICNDSMVGIKVDKVFCKIGTANGNEMNVYYNGLKIDPMSAIVLIEYWDLKLAT